MRVAIFLGSVSDYDVATEIVEVFQEFKIPYILEVTSAHRSPERTLKLVQKFEKDGAEVFIAVAGKAAHLAGFVASHSLLPVIGVPVESQTLGGLDALLSTVQMPRGIPVACMGMGKSGAANAALLAIQILSLKDEELQGKMADYRERMASQLEKESEKLKEKP
ncbi:MAG: 5-(carboxyamino)imidazole ribonucleotide mutase [Candidatus Aminicenantales bacterium]